MHTLTKKNRTSPAWELPHTYQGRSTLPPELNRPIVLQDISDSNRQYNTTKTESQEKVSGKLQFQTFCSWKIGFNTWFDNIIIFQYTTGIWNVQIAEVKT